MLTQKFFEAANLARMHMGATCHKSVPCVQSETDLVGMETVDRSLHDRLIDAVPFTFKPNLKNSGNPFYDKMPIKLRLEGKGNWLSKDRSDSEQRLSVKILVDWAEALLQDLKVTVPYGSTSRELLNKCTINNNILVSD